MTASSGERVAEIPRRGDLTPWLNGADPTGRPIGTRDFYMRRNLAIVFAGADAVGKKWLSEASTVRDNAREEAGEIVAIVAPETDVAGLPAIVDEDGSLAARFGLSDDDLPALFITDRFGTLFAASHGADATGGLRPLDIPGWLTFVACRCS